MKEQDRAKAEVYNQKQIANGDLTIRHVTELVRFWQEGHGLAGDAMAGVRETIPSIDWEIDENTYKPPAPPPQLQRGNVVALTLDQIVNRARYLVGEIGIRALDPHVRMTDAPATCPSIFYRLKGYNGGKDPTAPDPADRWSNPDSTFVNRTSDCIGGAAWCGGFDRYQPTRFAHIYDGWINTDSMLIDAKGVRKCFATVPQPMPGCFIVAPSNSPGHAIGHIGVVIGIPVNWNADSSASWSALSVVDIASRGTNRANVRTTGAGWFNARREGAFVVSKMVAA